MKVAGRRGCLHRVYREEASEAARNMYAYRRRCLHCWQVIPLGPATETYDVQVERMAADIAWRWMQLPQRVQDALIVHAPNWAMPIEQLAAVILEHHQTP